MAEEQLVEDSRFEQILKLDGLELQEFFEESPAEALFSNAQTYPQFFNENLVSPNRILKRLPSNPQSNIRVFYFQILRLGYEIQLENDMSRNVLLNFRRIVFHPEFEILFTQETEDQRDLFNDFQFKKLFAEFMVFLDKQQFPNIEEILYHYPIMDTIFIHILRSLLASQNINEEFDTKIPSEVVFSELSLLFELSVTSYGNCWKFENSDMFCYEESQDEIYLAYIVEDGEGEGDPNNFNQQEEVQYRIIDEKNDARSHLNQDLFPQPVPNRQPSIIPNPSYPQTMSTLKPPAPGNQSNGFSAYLQVPASKHRIPKETQDQGLSRNYDGFLSKVENTIKSSFSYNSNTGYNDKSSNYETSSYGLESSLGQQPSLTSTRYYEPPAPAPSYNYTPSSSYQPSYPNYNSYSHTNSNSYSNSYSNTTSNYYSKPYQPPYSSSYDTYNSYSSYSPSNLYDKYGSSSTYNTYESSYKPVQYIPSTIYKPEITSSFKPVEPTPLPNFDSYKPSSYSPKRDYASLPTSSYQPSSTYIQPPSSSYSTSVFNNYNYSSNVYQPTPTISYDTDGTGDYFKDFTSPDILSKLRAPNRENISKIRDSMKGVTRGGEFPPALNLKRSAIYQNNEVVEPKPDLYRNQSRSQFEYPQMYKSITSKPIDSSDLGYYPPPNPYPSSTSYYQSSYSQASY